MSDQSNHAEAFGNLSPGALWQYLVNLCHKSTGPRLSRVCAPIIRKLVVNKYGVQPLDLELEGLNLRCEIGNNYSEKKFIFTPWRFDIKERALLREQLAQGGVFLDIGANVGLYTLEAAKVLQGKKGRIVAFEPNPPVLNRFKFNLAANPQLHSELQLDIMDIGVADRDTLFELHVDNANLGQSSILSQGNTRSKSVSAEALSVVTIQCRPLLAVLNELDIERIDVLKIDIEGAEDMALMPYLKAAPRALLARLIIIENSQHLWKNDLFSQFEQVGYQRVFHNRSNSVYRLPITNCSPDN